MNAVHPLNGFSCFCRCLDVVNHMNASNHQHAIFGLNLASHFSRQVFIACVDLARLQRASESAGESTTGSGNDVVERCGMGLDNLRVDAVVFSDRAMDAKANGIFLRWEVCQT